MVWGAASGSGRDSLDASCCCDQTVYITCSKETMLDGRANVLAITPYTDRAAVDDELLCLESYLNVLLERFFEAPELTVPRYLQYIGFRSSRWELKVRELLLPLVANDKT